MSDFSYNLLSRFSAIAIILSISITQIENVLIIWGWKKYISVITFIKLIHIFIWCYKLIRKSLDRYNGRDFNLHLIFIQSCWLRLITHILWCHALIIKTSVSLQKSIRICVSLIFWYNNAMFLLSTTTLFDRAIVLIVCSNT